MSARTGNNSANVLFTRLGKFKKEFYWLWFSGNGKIEQYLNLSSNTLARGTNKDITANPEKVFYKHDGRAVNALSDVWAW